MQFVGAIDSGGHLAAASSAHRPLLGTFLTLAKCTIELFGLVVKVALDSVVDERHQEQRLAVTTLNDLKKYLLIDASVGKDAFLHKLVASMTTYSRTL
jgi:hypothetical protein